MKQEIQRILQARESQFKTERPFAKASQRPEKEIRKGEAQVANANKGLRGRTISMGREERFYTYKGSGKASVSSRATSQLKVTK